MGGIQHPRDTAGRDSSLAGDPTAYFARDTLSTRHHRMRFINRGIPRDLLRGIEQPWDTTGRDSVIAAIQGMFCAGSSNHGAPQQFSCSGVLGKTQSMLRTPPRDKKNIFSVHILTSAAMLHCTSRFGLSNAAKTNTSGHNVLLTFSYHRHHVVSGDRTGSNHSGVEEFLRKE